MLVIRPGERDIPPSRARAYSDHTACLLTDAHGPNGPAPVWAGMQDASLRTSAKVSYLAVIGPDTTANARTFVSSPTQRHCELVIAVGKSQADAVAVAVAVAHSDVTFAALGAPAGTGY